MARTFWISAKNGARPIVQIPAPSDFLPLEPATASGGTPAHERAGVPGGQRASTLSVRSITKRFGGLLALDRLSLEIERGEVVGLFGPDGAGKTLCFEAIMGLTAIDSGEVMLDGQDITRLTVDRRGIRGLGYLAAQASIFSGMTAAQNIAAVLELTERERAARLRRLDELIDEFGLAPVRDVPSSRLSGGERRRCEIARIMAISPVILLMDEPFAGIDPMAVTNLKETILRLRGRHIGILMSDQNLKEAIEVADRVYVIHEGSVIFAGEPRAMMSDRDVRRYYLGVDYSSD